MKLNEFQELSKRTMPYNGAPANQAEYENMLGNYALGLVGESIELLEVLKKKGEDYSDVIKEMGDVSHYAIGVAALTNLDLNFNMHYVYGDVEDCMDDLLYAAKNVSEAAKKIIYHRHDPINVSDDLIKIFDVLYTLGQIVADDYSEVLQTNLDKLKTRYPEKFNTADSINRVDVASE